MASPDGSSFEVHGALAVRRILLIVERDDFFADDALVARVVAYFSARGVTVVRYESRYAETARRISPRWSRGLPGPVRGTIKALMLLAYPARWAHFSPRYRERVGSVSNRAHALRAAIEELAEDREVFLLARSLGARIASLVADSAGVARMAALGYPFQSPTEGPNPARYLHLRSLRTPMLIVQGARDVYGGLEIANVYPLSPSTTMEFVDGDHGLRLDEPTWARVLDRVSDFFFSDSTADQTSDSEAGVGYVVRGSIMGG
ncbi:alpha/beta family hydrolase [Microbacterium sp. X-17]|uniref:alpha/beta family hydrolase n=1 Tax=Microbacterium sp. X-17 TaxID=3144404 RepID=UPI0031F59856